MRKLILIYIIYFKIIITVQDNNILEKLKQTSSVSRVFTTNVKNITEPYCSLDIINLSNTIYILYDVNPPEGFNLRRDVYIRLAVFINRLRRKKTFQNVRLVLPPWRRLYHWKSNHIFQENLPWSSFFDLESLRRYAPILDFSEFLHELKLFGLHETKSSPILIDRVFQLLHFEEMFENGIFRDKYEFAKKCRREQYSSKILQQSILKELKFDCVHFQGSVNLLERLFQYALQQLPQNDVKIFTVLNAEIVLHDHWGNREFWNARRSMRFAKHLTHIADKYRLSVFKSTNEKDLVQRPPMWEEEYPKRSAIGGSYLCAHLRRGDFLQGHEKTIPTLKSAAMQIKQKMHDLNLTQLFLATDASAFEVTNLKSYLQRVRVHRFSAESLEQKALIRDGGIAIIDQLICSHSRYFLGTYESTFTYRIYEEREILGFPKSSTFNTICKMENLQNCSKNTAWSIVY